MKTDGEIYDAIIQTILTRFEVTLYSMEQAVKRIRDVSWAYYYYEYDEDSEGAEFRIHVRRNYPEFTKDLS